MTKIHEDVSRFHNGGITKEVFMATVADLGKLQKQMDEIKVKIKAREKRAKDDGIDLKLAKEVQKRRKLTTAEQIKRHNVMLSYQRFLGMPIAEQMDFLDPEPRIETMTDDERRDHWRTQGYEAGINGDGKDTCPHQLETEAASCWIEGWEKGQAELGSKIGKADPKISKFPGARAADNPDAAKDALAAGAEKKRGRGRPRKNSEPAAEPAPPAPPEGEDPGAQQPDPDTRDTQQAQQEPTTPPAPPEDGDTQQEQVDPPAPPGEEQQAASSEDELWDKADPKNKTQH